MTEHYTSSKKVIYLQIHSSDIFSILVEQDFLVPVYQGHLMQHMHKYLLYTNIFIYTYKDMYIRIHIFAYK